MEIEQALREAIVAGVGDEIGDQAYPDEAPFGTLPPYVVFTQVGGQPVNFVDDAIPSKKNGRWQINVWAVLRDDASRIARRIEDTLIQAPLRAMVLGALAGANDAGSGLRGTQQDFSIWF